MPSRRTFSLLAAFAAGGALVLACGTSTTATSTGTETDDIIDGVVDVPANDATVLVVHRKADGTSTCTGSMVAPNLVLTARHCVSDTDELSTCLANGQAAGNAAIRADSPPENLLVYAGTDALVDFANKSASLAKGKALVVEKEAKVLCNNDIAFIVLDKEVDLPIAPVRLDSGPRVGEKVTTIGYGFTENGRPKERQRRDDVEVLNVGPVAKPGAILGASEFQVGESICSGDSGGPAYAASGAIVGVVARGGNGKQDEVNKSAHCVGPQTRNTFTHLAEKKELIARAFEASGFEPVRETTLAPDAGADGGRDAGTTTGRDAGASGGRDASAESDAGRTPGRKNGQNCTENADCASEACFQQVCRAQCIPGDCAVGWTCAKRGEFSLCLQNVSDVEPGEEEPLETFPTRESDPSLKAKPKAEAGGCSTSSSGGGTSGLGLVGLALAFLAVKRRR